MVLLFFFVFFALGIVFFNSWDLFTGYTTNWSGWMAIMVLFDLFIALEFKWLSKQKHVGSKTLRGAREPAR